MSEPEVSTRRQLIQFARNRRSRVSEFSALAPTDRRPAEVRNPDGELDPHSTDRSAWEFIAMKLGAAHPVEIITLRKPEGNRGYVMHIALEPDRPELYVKLQLGSGKVIGRSFHYSEQECLT